MSSPEKFRLFVRNTTDPSTITYAAFTAGIKQADNKLSGYEQGAAGYGKRRYSTSSRNELKLILNFLASSSAFIRSAASTDKIP